MDELHRIAGSLTAVRAVGSVISAVWALSRAQLPRVERAVADAGEYLAWLDRVVDDLAGPPLEAAPERSFTVALGPERPFCGDLGRGVLDGLPPRGEVGLVGTRLGEMGRRVLRNEPERIAFVRPGPTGIDDLAAVSGDVSRALLAHVSARRVPAEDPIQVVLLHPGGRGAAPVQSVLLPARRGAPREDLDLFSPPAVVARAAAREGVTGRLRHALGWSLLAETRARAAVAERARRAVEDREAELTTALRVLEREQVTTELVELATAAEAGASPAATGRGAP